MSRLEVGIRCFFLAVQVIAVGFACYFAWDACRIERRAKQSNKEWWAKYDGFRHLWQGTDADVDLTASEYANTMAGQAARLRGAWLELLRAMFPFLKV